MILDNRPESDRSYMGGDMGLKLRLFLLLFCISVTPVHAEETVKVGVIYGKTGFAARDNSPLLRSARMKIQQLNNKDGLSGRKIELLEFDNFSSPIGSKVAAEKAINAGVHVIITASWSTNALAAARVAQKRKVPMIAAFSTAPAVTKVGDCIFRVCFTNDRQARALAHFVRNDLNAESAAILRDLASDYSMGLSSSFKEEYELLGGRVKEIVSYKRNQNDFWRATDKCSDLQVKVLLFTGHGEGIQMAAYARRLGIKAIPVAGDGWPLPQVEEHAEKIGAGYFLNHWHSEMGGAAQLIAPGENEKIESLAGGRALIYDALTLFLDAAARSGSLDSDQIRRALRETREFKGVTGTITFDENGDPIKPVVVMSIENGRVHFLKSMMLEF